MIKLKGIEHPVSMVKFVLPDEVLDKLEWVREYLKLNNNVEAFGVCIQTSYNMLKTHKEYLDKGDISEMLKEDTEVKVSNK